MAGVRLRAPLLGFANGENKQFDYSFNLRIGSSSRFDQPLGECIDPRANWFVRQNAERPFEPDCASGDGLKKVWVELNQHPFHRLALEREIVVLHRRHEGDCAITKSQSSASREKAATNFPEQNQLGDIVEMHEIAEPGGVLFDKHALGNDGHIGRELHRLADRTKRHGKIVIVFSSSRKQDWLETGQLQNSFWSAVQ